MTSSPAEPRPVAYRLEAPISTSRLVLRPYAVADIDDYLAYYSRDDVTRFLLHGPITRQEAEKRLLSRETATGLNADGDLLVLAIELPETADAPARVVGDVDMQLKSAVNRQATIGWALHPDVHGLGYAAEAAGALLDLAFGVAGVHRVFAELDPRNEASAALCRRLGMRHEAHLVDELFFKGAWGDTDIYAILDREWTGTAG